MERESKSTQTQLLPLWILWLYPREIYLTNFILANTKSLHFKLRPLHFFIKALHIQNVYKRHIIILVRSMNLVLKSKTKILNMT